MKKHFLLILTTLFMLSCSKKETIITGKINNASPLGRMELIDPSSVATLPIANIGFDEKGNFSDTLKVDKNGVYILVYKDKINFIYLEKGKNINIIGNDANFPEDIKVSGENQGNNEFLIESQKYITSYLSKLDVSVLGKPEAEFIKELEKYASDINKKIDEIAKAKKASSELVQWKKDDFNVNLLMISNQYELIHGNIAQKANFKTTEKYKEAQKKLEKDSYIKDFPAYRQYLVNKLEEDYGKFATPHLQAGKLTQTEIFLNFLETKKEFSQEQKDYLAAFIATRLDLHPRMEKGEQIMKVLNEKIKTESIKKDLEKVYNTLAGIKIGNPTPEIDFLKQDGKTMKLSEFKGKSTLLVFYSSWAPRMVEIAPVLKQITDFYKAKLNVAYINMDDDAKQFQKTSKSLFNGFHGVQLYAKGGLKSEAAKQFYIYGFKLPSFVILDKDGKIATKSIMEAGDSTFINELNKHTGLVAPVPQAPAEGDEAHYEGDGHDHSHGGHK